MPNPEDITHKIGQIKQKQSRIVEPMKPQEPMVRPRGVRHHTRPMAFDAFFWGIWIVVGAVCLAQLVLPLFYSR
ncbi:MAG: hypothetical protein JW739_05035 [Opitutales bacterium]|nr:hypothetical protein [Opitutales bacterium]